MLSEPLDLNNVPTAQLFDYLYDFFHRDFVSQRTHLNEQIYIDPQSHRVEDGKERVFWHLTTRKQKRQIRQGNSYVTEMERLPDFRRSERIEWIRQIITQHGHDKIKMFYHQESNPKRNIRLYLWAEDDDFVVILQKLGRSSSFLVTSFFVDNHRKRQDYQARFEAYKNGDNPELLKCEWF